MGVHIRLHLEKRLLPNSLHKVIRGAQPPPPKLLIRLGGGSQSRSERLGLVLVRPSQHPWPASDLSPPLWPSDTEGPLAYQVPKAHYAAAQRHTQRCELSTPPPLRLRLPTRHPAKNSDADGSLEAWQSKPFPLEKS